MKEKKYADRKNDKPDLKPAAQAFARDPGVPWDYRGSHSVYQKEIEEEFGLRPSTATEALKTLEKKGLIRREAEKQDARYKKIVFTEKAETIREALRTEIEESEQLLLKGISTSEQKEFLRITEQMLKNLDAAGKEG